MNLRPSSQVPSTLPTVGSASSQGTLESVQRISSQASSGQASSVSGERDQRGAARQGVHHQRAAVGAAAAQPLPPAPQRHRDEEQLQRGLAVELAVGEQQRVHQRRRHRQRPGERMHAHLAAHHPQRDDEGDDLDPGDVRAPAVKAGTRSGWARASSDCSMGVTRAGSRARAREASLAGRQDDEQLVGLGHAQLRARLFLDDLEAFLQVGDLGLELVVALRASVVGAAQRRQLSVILGGRGDAGLSPSATAACSRTARR